MKHLTSRFLVFLLGAALFSALPFPAQARPAVPTSTVDDYGYTFEQISKEFISFEIDDPAGPSGRDQVSGPVDLGFSFKFYGRLYTQVYISTNGLLSLGAPVSSPNKTLIPKISLPNNLIAPFWAPMTGTSGIIRYHLEGIAPNRKFAVEWQNVAMRNPPLGSTNQAWFQAILKESGEIVFYYFTFPNSAQPSVGIEDESGWYGNGMGPTPTLISQTSWHFAPPAAAARVKLTPPVQDAFATPGSQVSFPLTVLNAGDVGTDTFKITATSAWTVALFQADGITPLGDSNSDGKPDTGPLAAGASLDIVVKVSAPLAAGVGTENTATLEFASSLQPAVKKSAALRAVVPAPFQQVYHDDATPTKVNLDLVGPFQRPSFMAESLFPLPVTPTVAALQNGGTIQAWSAWRTNGDYHYLEIEYALYDSSGNVTKAPTRLTTQSAANNVWDYPPALAVAPDGSIGLLWVNFQQTIPDYFNYLYNMYFAVLDANGNVTTAPLNLTGNTTWQTYYTFNAYDSPTITATGDNRFVLAFYNSDKGNNYRTNLWLSSRTTAGVQVTALTNYSNNTWATHIFRDPTLAAVSGNRVLLAYHYFFSIDGSSIKYILLNSDCSIPAGSVETLLATSSSDNFSQPDAVLLANGRVLVGWLTFRGLQFATLDANFVRLGPVGSIPTLFNADVTRLSVTTDGASQGIFTWAQDDQDYDIVYGTPLRPRLFYALVDANGSLKTSTLVYRTSPAGLDTSAAYASAPHAALFNAAYKVYIPKVSK